MPDDMEVTTQEQQHGAVLISPRIQVALIKRLKICVNWHENVYALQEVLIIK